MLSSIQFLPALTHVTYAYRRTIWPILTDIHGCVLLGWIGIVLSPTMSLDIYIKVQESGSPRSPGVSKRKNTYTTLSPKNQSYVVLELTRIITRSEHYQQRLA